MTPQEKEQYEDEQRKGNAAQHAYNQFIKGFCEEKRATLFDSFRSLPLTDETNLIEVKRMLYAIDTLEDDIMTVINSGKMASQSLTEGE